VADGLLAELIGDVETAVADIRSLVYNLRPPALDELGLTTGQTVLALYVVSAILGVIGLSLHTPPEAPSIGA